MKNPLTITNICCCLYTYPFNPRITLKSPQTTDDSSGPSLLFADFTQLDTGMAGMYVTLYFALLQVQVVIATGKTPHFHNSSSFLVCDFPDRCCAVIKKGRDEREM